MEITFRDSLFIASSGILTVFLLLAFLSGIVIIISGFLNMFSKNTEETAPIEPPIPVDIKTEDTPEEYTIEEQEADEDEDAIMAFGGQLSLMNVDDKTAVCIMAIIAEESGIPLEELCFRSIKALI